MSGYVTVVLSGIAIVAITAILLNRSAAVGSIAKGVVSATGNVANSFGNGGQG